MKHREIMLSAVVIAKNEEKRIGQCLRSLSFADEIIVVDNGSNDQTKVIAEQTSVRVVQYEGKDFSALRNVGKKESKGRWILYVDADEVVTQELKEEILKTIGHEDLPAGRQAVSKGQKLSDAHCHTSHKYTGYFIKRRNFYLGYEWSVQDRMQRLFLRDKLVRWEGKLHETAIIDGHMGELQEPLIHNTHRTLEEMVTKTNEWSDEEAALRLSAHHPLVSWWRLVRVMMTGFSRSFFLEGGWRAGTVGWIESIFQAFSMFITYAKLWELQNKSIK